MIFEVYNARFTLQNSQDTGDVNTQQGSAMVYKVVFHARK